MNIPEWITAVVAVVALGAAIWAGVISRSLLLVEQRRDDERQQRTLAEQATLVGAWMIFCPDLPERGVDRRDGIMVRNSSDASVYDLVVQSCDFHGRQLPLLELTILPPGEYVILGHREYPWSLARTTDEIPSAIRPITKRKELRVTQLDFVDAQGIPWTRAGATLERVVV